MPTPTSVDANRRKLTSRFLQLQDIPALLQLESRQWDAEQAATQEALHKRIIGHPTLCVGAFCADTGEALCSLFLKPVEKEKMQHLRSWADCAGDLAGSTHSSSRSLFGISMTCVDPAAMAAMDRFFWPTVLRGGWLEVYLGSPMPGLRKALSQDPNLTAADYAHGKQRKLPRDPQLRYYHRKGLPDIVAVLPGYFPHGDSLDYGVLIRGSTRDIAKCSGVAVATEETDAPWHETQGEAAPA
jgi:hypothetical protein